MIRVQLAGVSIYFVVWYVMLGTQLVRVFLTCCVVSGCSLTGMFIIYCVVLDCGQLESLSMLCRVVCDSGG